MLIADLKRQLYDLYYIIYETVCVLFMLIRECILSNYGFGMQLRCYNIKANHINSSSISYSKEIKSIEQ